MYQLRNYVMGSWVSGTGDGQLLFNAVTGSLLLLHLQMELILKQPCTTAET
jgi:hypothetical protein